jgi:WhiB family transcriptional regulator, redox-sensing transcriptional regulator
MQKIGGSMGLRPKKENGAKCAELDDYDVELFFSGVPEDILYSKKICAQCPIQEECLDYALDTNQNVGVWGGMSENERKKLRRKIA